MSNEWNLQKCKLRRVYENYLGFPKFQFADEHISLDMKYFRRDYTYVEYVDPKVILKQQRTAIMDLMST